MKKIGRDLDKDVKRKERFLELNKTSDFTRWRATPREEVSDDLDKKMISMYNYPKSSHLARCGCFQSHISLLEHIVENKLNDVLICEDDAAPTHVPVPTEYPKDSILYLGGFIHKKKMTDNSEVILQSEEGINGLPDDHRILMTMSYIIPTWELAEYILEKIKSLKRYRAIDILYGNIDVNTRYLFPAAFDENGMSSTIHKKSKRANRYYKWVNY
jgi:hypothetical protein